MVNPGGAVVELSATARRRLLRGWSRFGTSPATSLIFSMFWGRYAPGLEPSTRNSATWDLSSWLLSPEAEDKFNDNDSPELSLHDSVTCPSELRDTLHWVLWLWHVSLHSVECVQMHVPYSELNSPPVWPSSVHRWLQTVFSFCTLTQAQSLERRTSPLGHLSASYKKGKPSVWNTKNTQNRKNSGVRFSKVPKLFGRISGDTILFVSSKRRRLEARNFAVILIFIPFTTYEKTSFTE